jgi:hypothetical protein
MTRLALAFAWAALTSTCVTACGGSSSETPFPQPPLERALKARHDAARPATDADLTDAAPKNTAPKNAAPVESTTPSAATEIRTPTSK